MGLLDVYLQKNGKKRYDVFKQTGVSQQTLSSVNKKNVGSYSVKTIQAIAETVGKSEGIVLDELLQMEKERPYFEVYNTEDLLLAFENRESNIVIKETYKAELEKYAESQLSDTEKLGFELGSHGTISIFSEVIYQLINYFSKEDAEQKKIESHLRRYNIMKLNEKELLLYLRQFDY